MKIDNFFVATKGFVLYKNKALLLRESQAYTEGTNDKWSLPGGRMNPEETYKQALNREIAEETGLVTKINSPIHIDEWFPAVAGKQWHIVAIFFLCEAKTDTVKLSTDHADYKWVNPAEYKLLDLDTATRRCFEIYIKK